MFVRSDLDALDSAQLVDWRYMSCYPGLHYAVYPPYAFRVPDSEQTVRITRAPKRQGDNGVQFWVSAESADAPLKPEYAAKYLKSAHFRPIQEAEFNSLVQAQCVDLIAPPILPLRQPGGFIGALSMHALETEFIVSLFAEYADEFIHFYWDTTA